MVVIDDRAAANEYHVMFPSVCRAKPGWIGQRQLVSVSYSKMRARHMAGFSWRFAIDDAA
jgi:hypothetical protein